MTALPADEPTVRHRTYEWDDPMATARAVAGLSGLDAMRAMLSGEIPPPPIVSTLGIDLLEIGEGRAVFGARAAEHMYNPIGSVHGGVYATLLDSAAGCAVQTRLPAGTGYTSLDLTVKFLRSMTPASGLVRCTGTVTYLGRRTALAEARIEDESGRLLATAVSSCLILAPGA